MPTVWEQYKALPPRTRIYLGVGVMIFATAGLYIGDALEPALDPARRPPKESKISEPSSTTTGK
ncbi:hypothetical protein FBU30_003852 [Linnemannia zychae]|nr:hypothetical protein FBU30_003852 [Linnemannia zychae]